MEEARLLREELEQQQQQQGHHPQEEPDDLLQRLQILSHENREYKRKLVGGTDFKSFGLILINGFVFFFLHRSSSILRKD